MSEQKQLILDSSMLNNLQMCPYKFWLTHELDLTTLITAEPLERGDLLHYLYKDYNLKRKANPQLVYSDRWEIEVEETMRKGEFYTLNNSLPVDDADNIIRSFKEHASFTRMSGETILEVEKPFLKTISETEDLAIHMAGVVDVVVDTPNLGINNKDYKSESRKSEPLQLANQFTCYTWATKIPLFTVEKVGLQKTLTPDQKFRSYQFLYSDIQIQEWVTDTIWWAELLAYFIQENRWPRNRSSCDKYGGCAFRAICNASTEEGREMMMAKEFKKGPKWDPTAVLEAELGKGKEND